MTNFPRTTATTWHREGNLSIATWLREGNLSIASGTAGRREDILPIVPAGRREGNLPTAGWKGRKVKVPQMNGKNKMRRKMMIGTNRKSIIGKSMKVYSRKRRGKFPKDLKMVNFKK